MQIETSRLLLRPPALEDAEDIFARYAQDREVTLYLQWAPHSDIQTTREFLRRCLKVWEQETAFPWVVIRKTDRNLMGMIELGIEGHRACLGYVLARPYWGQGFATEAASAVVNWAIAQPPIHRVWATCDCDNHASARVLEKAGMQREGLLWRWAICPTMGSVPRDSWSYAKVK